MQSYYVDNPEESVHVVFWLTAEVKKTKSPWVVFSSEWSQVDPMPHDQFSSYPDYGADFELMGLLGESFPGVSHPRIGRTGTTVHDMAPKKGGQNKRVEFNTSSLFDASMSAAKAAHVIDQNMSKSLRIEAAKFFRFVIPMVIVNGELFEAYIDMNGSLVVERTDHLIYRQDYVSTVYDTHGFLVQLVQSDYLASVIDQIEDYGALFLENAHRFPAGNSDTTKR